jgi:hypothetical protein
METFFWRGKSFLSADVSETRSGMLLRKSKILLPAMDTSGRSPNRTGECFLREAKAEAVITKALSEALEFSGRVKWVLLLFDGGFLLTKLILTESVCSCHGIVAL